MTSKEPYLFVILEGEYKEQLPRSPEDGEGCSSARPGAIGFQEIIHLSPGEESKSQLVGSGFPEGGELSESQEGK